MQSRVRTLFWRAYGCFHSYAVSPLLLWRPFPLCSWSSLLNLSTPPVAFRCTHLIVLYACKRQCTEQPANVIDVLLALLQWNMAALTLAVLLLAGDALAAPQSRRLLQQPMSSRMVSVWLRCVCLTLVYSAHNLQVHSGFNFQLYLC